MVSRPCLMRTSFEMYNQAVICQSSLLIASELEVELKNFFVLLTGMFVMPCIFQNYLKAL